MITVDKSNTSCYAVDGLSTKSVFPVKKDLIVKVFNLLTRKNEANFNCTCKCQLNSGTCSSNQ